MRLYSICKLYPFWMQKPWAAQIKSTWSDCAKKLNMAKLYSTVMQLKIACIQKKPYKLKNLKGHMALRV